MFVLFLRSTYIPAQVLTSEERHKITVYCPQLDYHPNINLNPFRIHCRDALARTLATWLVVRVLLMADIALLTQVLTFAGMAHHCQRVFEIALADRYRPSSIV